MYKNDYHTYVVCEAAQVVTLDHDHNTLNYHEVDELYDNEYLQIYDITNNRPVGHIDYIADDKEIYNLAHQLISQYEGQNFSSDDAGGAFSN